MSTPAKPGLLVLTHGRLAADLVEALGRIVGETDELRALAMEWDDALGASREQLDEQIAELDRGSGVVILTDMFGGTPSNLALTRLEPGRVEVVTGVNLPMLIKYVGLDEGIELADMAQQLAEQGRSAIHVASTLLEREGRVLEGVGEGEA